MAVYIDPLMRHGWRLGPSCHLFADTVVELHAFACKLGLRRAWFQDKRLAHYDLTMRRRVAALAMGVVPLDRKSAVKKWRELENLCPKIKTI